MRISQHRQKLIGGKVEIAPWLAAPLYMANRTLAFAALDERPSESNYLDLIITSIHQRYWNDLWRIEIASQNAPGVLLRIYAVLDARSIRVVRSESSVDTSTGQSSISIVISCNEYASGGGDKSHQQRVAGNQLTLPELETQLTVHLIDVLLIDGAGRPRLKVRRMGGHRRLWEQVDTQQKFVLNLHGSVFQDNALMLSQRARDLIRRTLGTGDCYFAPEVDTKERLIRCLIFAGHGVRDTKLGIHHLRVAFTEGVSSIPREVLEVIFANHGNVLRQQVRPHKMDAVDNRTLEDFNGAHHHALETIDVTFDFSLSVFSKRPGAAPSEHSQLRRIENRMNELAKTRKRTGHVMQLLSCSWHPMEAKTNGETPKRQSPPRTTRTAKAAKPSRRKTGRSSKKD